MELQAKTAEAHGPKIWRPLTARPCRATPLKDPKLKFREQCVEPSEILFLRMSEQGGGDVMKAAQDCGEHTAIAFAVDLFVD